MPRRLVPQLVTALQGYTRRDFAADLAAGVIVGVVALPLAIAFGIASGVTPQQGIFTAIIAGFLISALGCSTVQIGGPTGAFVVIVSGIVQQYGYAGLAVATAMAGVLDEIGDDNIFGNIDDALNRARRELGLPEETPPATALPTVAREQRPSPAEGIPSAVHPDLLDAEAREAAKRG